MRDAIEHRLDPGALFACSWEHDVHQRSPSRVLTPRPWVGNVASTSATWVAGAVILTA